MKSFIQKALILVLQKRLKNWEERGQKDTPGYKRTEALMIKERNKLVKDTPKKEDKRRLMSAFIDTVGGRKKRTKRKNRRKKKKRTKRKRRK